MAQSNKSKNLVSLVLNLAIVIGICYLGSFIFTRFDLTSEKRHSLTDYSKSVMENLDDVIYIRVYLEGEFPADVTRLRNATKEKLDELKAYGGSKFEYEFINPSESEDQETREALWKKLIDGGLQYTNISIANKDGLQEQIIFPGAILSHKGKELPLQILRSQERVPSAEMLNKSINNLEYELINAIKQITQEKKPRVAIIHGHGELEPLEIEDYAKALDQFYDVFRTSIDGILGVLDDFDAILIAKPTQAIPDKDKYIIDQFIMKGGKVMWLIDGISASMDSLRASKAQQTMGLENDLNIDDMLFDYGIRIKKNLLLDASCSKIPITTGYYGDKPQMQLFNWYFNPIVIPTSNHPIVTNIDPIHFQFVNSIDTIFSANVKKTILLTTSEYTRIFKSPVRINLGIVSIDLNFKGKSRPYQPVSVLLEGEFKSFFKDRITDKISENPTFKFKEKSEPTRMLVVSDGDIAKNKISADSSIYYPLGYDTYAKRKLYGNREFLVNGMNYLLGDASLIGVRSREIKLRKLNPEKIVSDKIFWQVINTALPVLLVAIMGIIQIFIRKRKFQIKHD
jgi:ABC-2 type transport system permease protein